jgi:hypothetical protein
MTTTTTTYTTTTTHTITHPSPANGQLRFVRNAWKFLQTDSES